MTNGLISSNMDIRKVFMVEIGYAFLASRVDCAGECYGRYGLVLIIYLS